MSRLPDVHQSFFVPMEISFDAYTEGLVNETFPNLKGGDKSFHSRDGNTTAFQTAAHSKDLLNGTYTFQLHLPPHFDAFQMELMHYNTCFERLTRVGPARNDFHHVKMGPMEVPRQQYATILLSATNDQNITNTKSILFRHECQVDELMQGVSLSKQKIHKRRMDFYLLYSSEPAG